MPDIEQVIVFRHCTRMYANLYRRYAACAAKKLAECARESRRWEKNLNWQIQGCTVVASHLDNLYATVDKPLHLDKTKWNVYNFRSRSVSSQTAELPRGIWFTLNVILYSCPHCTYISRTARAW